MREQALELIEEAEDAGMVGVAEHDRSRPHPLVSEAEQFLG